MTFNHFVIQIQPIRQNPVPFGLHSRKNQLNFQCSWGQRPQVVSKGTVPIQLSTRKLFCMDSQVQARQMVTWRSQRYWKTHYIQKLILCSANQKSPQAGRKKIKEEPGPQIPTICGVIHLTPVWQNVHHLTGVKLGTGNKSPKSQRKSLQTAQLLITTKFSSSPLFPIWRTVRHNMRHTFSSLLPFVISRPSYLDITLKSVIPRGLKLLTGLHGG